MRSESDAHRKRPPILNRESSPVKPAAMAATCVFCADTEVSKGGRDADQLSGEDFLQQRGSHADDADARGHIQTEHAPDQPELRRLPGLAEVHIPGGDHGIARLIGGGRPALRFPAGRRNAVSQRTGQHEHEVDDRERKKGLPDTDAIGSSEMIHQAVGQRCADHCAAAKAHDRHAGGHAAPVREPFDQRRDRRDIPQPQPDAADHARAQPQQSDLVDINAVRSEHQPAAPAQSRGHTGFARAGMFKPAAPDGRGRAEKDEEKRVRPAQHGDRPVAG